MRPADGEVGKEESCTECFARSAAISVVLSLKIPLSVPDITTQSDGMLARQLGFSADLGTPILRGLSEPKA